MRKLTIPLILALAATATIVPGASAHGDDNGLYGETANGTGKSVVAYARFVTEKVHRIHVVRVCLQRRKAPGKWRTLDCAKEKHFKKRDDTVAVSAGCKRTRLYRAKVFGHVITKDDKIRHRARGTTPAEAIACD